MKKGELKKLAQTYAALIPQPWKKMRNDFLRWNGDWVQILTFNPWRFADRYIPRNCFEFLKIPGEPTGGLLLQELQHPNGTQRSVDAAKISNPASSDYAPKVFEEMVRQFKPAILAPLKSADVKHLLDASLNYWPHPYALCVMAAEAGDRASAERYFQAYEATIREVIAYPGVEAERQWLLDCMKEAGSDALRAKLAQIEAEKLRALKLGE